MNEAASTCSCAKAASGEGWRWATGLAITALAVSAVVAAVLVMPRAVEANRRACMAAWASDLHADIAAFGQDPAWQARYVEALAACSR
ncbi:MAG TPA: hypothetical protein VMJ11_31630 [Paraburkholderia sp.]|uniref:hypothetical protein n=1 Tax=Paraburkholderia sp. TaxID=1926495 RepID=UPI002BABB70F|nr:hypothetical protein [Paraburkholderia sp.]HTR11126.1 hypothetical protein [Paraburkholderia sp.]